MATAPFPMPAGTGSTCDIYRSGNAPPSAPDVSAVPCFLKAAFAEGQERGEAGTSNHYTHILLVGAEVDIRDGNNAATGTYTIGATCDTVWVPDQNGTRFHVLFVERVGRGTTQDHKRAYLARSQVTWPSNDL